MDSSQRVATAEFGKRVETASKLMERIERANWQPTTIDDDDYRLELHEVHGMTEVGFVLWRKRSDGQLDLITSGHTFQGALVGSEAEPLVMPDATQQTIMELLAR